MITAYPLWLLYSLLLPVVMLTAAMLWPMPNDQNGTEISTKG